MKGKFKQCNDEVNELYKSLQDGGFTHDEIKRIFAPFKPRGKHWYYSIALIVLGAFFIYHLVDFERTSWHLSAIGRILLIKSLQFWDWTVWKNEKCLLERTKSTSEVRFNCHLCEDIDKIDFYQNITADFLKTRYLDLHQPVILQHWEEKWPTSADILNDVLQNTIISDSLPCSQVTNICNGPTHVGVLLERGRSFNHFFLHFQNCQLDVVKQFRAFFPRPRFLPVELAPIQYSWLVWSRNYTAANYKRVDLVEKVGVFGQVLGGNFIRLLPRANCVEECEVVEVELKAGEFLLVTSLWNLEYRPGSGENLAVILETR